jgi:hypothetical protein
VLILFGFMLLILAVAIGLLFAMCAELSQRIGSSSGAGTANVEGYVHPVERPGVYLRPDAVWPREFDSITSRDAFLLIVLSTVCTTCASVAGQLGQGWAERGTGRLGIVISTPDVQRGVSFVADHHLDGIPHIIDEDGAWTAATLGLSLSPVGLFFISGSLQGTYTFNQVEMLWHAFTEEIVCNQQNQELSQQAGYRDQLAEGSSLPSAPVA